MFKLVVALVVLLSCNLFAQERPLPIIDMHLHANRANDNGPPPTYLCPGFENSAHDPAKPLVPALPIRPACAKPLVGATTDESLMKTTLEISRAAQHHRRDQRAAPGSVARRRRRSNHPVSDVRLRVRRTLTRNASQPF
jgi:hypothetical protein